MDMKSQGHVKHRLHVCLHDVRGVHQQVPPRAPEGVVAEDDLVLVLAQVDDPHKLPEEFSHRAQNQDGERGEC